MRQNSKTRNMAVTGMLVAAGLIIPFITGHAFGVPGTVLLPMHLPVYLMGMLCGPLYGLLGGIITPVLSSILTGMPAPYPMLPVMIGELAVYGLLGGLFYHSGKLKIYPALLAAMILGRIVHGIIFAIMMFAGSKPVSFASVFASNIDGIPGTVIQLILVPVCVKAFEKLMERESKQEAEGQMQNAGIQDMQTQTRQAEAGKPGQAEAADDLQAVREQAKQLIAEGKASFVVIRQDEIVYQDLGNGIRPIMKVMENNREILFDAVIVDKIVGKAAAILLTLGGASDIYGELMSRSAEDYLTERGKKVSYGRCIQVISNRTGDGICPMERAVAEIDDPVEGYEKLKETVKQLSRKAI